MNRAPGAAGRRPRRHAGRPGVPRPTGWSASSLRPDPALLGLAQQAEATPTTLWCNEPAQFTMLPASPQ